MRSSALYYLFLGMLFVLGRGAFAQVHEAGLPLIHNYAAYGNQVWTITQDQRGIMYFGVNSGVLVFDGTHWKKTPISTGGIVRALAIDSSGRMYVGGVGTFGYLEAGPNGSTGYVPISQNLPAEHQNFSDVWKIFIAKEGVYFQSYESLILFTEGKFKVWKPEAGKQFYKAQWADETVYVLQRGTGIFKLQDQQLRFLKGTEAFADERIFLTRRKGPGELLIGSYRQGLFSYDEKSGEMKAFKLENGQELSTYQIYSYTPLENQSFALGSIGGGLFVYNEQGLLLNHFNQEKGLKGNTPISYFRDDSGALWVGTENGVSRVEIKPGIRAFDSRLGIQEEVGAIARLGNQLFFGSAASSNLYSLSATGEAKKLPDFNLLQTFRLLRYPAPDKRGNEKLLIASADGLFSYDGRLTKINDGTPVMGLCISAKDPARIYIAGSGEVASYYYQQGKFEFEKSEKLPPDGYTYITADVLGNIWFGSTQNGLYAFRESDWAAWVEGKSEKLTLRNYQMQQGLPNNSLNFVFAYGKTLLVAANGSAVYAYSENCDCFEPFEPLNKHHTAQKVEISSIEQDQEGNIWYGSNKGRGVYIRKPDGSFEHRLGLLRKIPTSSIQGVVMEEGAHMLFGTHSGLYRINKAAVLAAEAPERSQTLLHKVLVDKDSLLFYGSTLSEMQDSLLYFKAAIDTLNKIPYSRNGLRFEFSFPEYGAESSTRFSYKLEGFDREWSEWTGTAFKEYTNLPEGSYTFRVKGLGAEGLEGKEARYAFSILPPWYRSLYAYGFYLLAFVGIFYTGLQLYALRLKLKNRRLEQIVTERTQEILEQKQELERRKEELEEALHQIHAQNQELKVLNSTKDKFFSIVAHDLKGPLNSLSSFSYLLANHAGAMSMEEIRLIASDLNSSVKNTISLTDNLLTWARSQMEKISFEPKTLSVNELILESLRLFEQIARDKQISLNSTLAEEDHVWADEDQLRFIIRNLLNNALKFTRPGGSIRISSLRQGGTVSVLVADNGIGMSERALSKLFNLEKNNSSPGTAGEKGTGLGLLLCKEFIDKNGGSIEVESTLDQGSTFSIRLKQAQPAGMPQQRPEVLAS